MSEVLRLGTAALANRNRQLAQGPVAETRALSFADVASNNQGW